MGPAADEEARLELRDSAVVVLVGSVGSRPGGATVSGDGEFPAGSAGPVSVCAALPFIWVSDSSSWSFAVGETWANMEVKCSTLSSFSFAFFALFK